MTDRQLRYRLRKHGLLLRKRGDGYMIVDGETNGVLAGYEGNGFSLSFEEAVEFVVRPPVVEL